MNKNTKELIAKAVPYKDGTPLYGIYVIPSERPYEGPWAPNDYEHMILIGLSEDENGEFVYYLIENEIAGNDIDVLSFFRSKVQSIDVPHKYSAVRIIFSEPVIIKERYSSISPVCAQTKEDLKTL